MKKSNYDHLFKIVIIGNSYVGKSSLLLRFTVLSINRMINSTTISFLPSESTSYIIYKKFKTIIVKQSKIKLQIWDTAGTEKFRTITAAYYKGADAIVVCFDYSDLESFKSLTGWMEEVNKQCHPDALKLLVGTKFDIEQKVVKPTDIIEFIQKHQIKMFDTSAKTNYQIPDVFNYISERLLEVRLKKAEQASLVAQIPNEVTPKQTNILRIGTQLVKNKALQMKSNCCAK